MKSIAHNKCHGCKCISFVTLFKRSVSTKRAVQHQDLLVARKLKNSWTQQFTRVRGSNSSRFFPRPRVCTSPINSLSNVLNPITSFSQFDTIHRYLRTNPKFTALYTFPHSVCDYQSVRINTRITSLFHYVTHIPTDPLNLRITLTHHQTISPSTLRHYHDLTALYITSQTSASSPALCHYITSHVPVALCIIFITSLPPPLLI